MFLEAEAAVLALKHREAAIVPEPPVPDPLAAAAEGVADGADAGEDAGSGGTATAGDGTAATGNSADAAAEDAQGLGEGAGRSGVRVRAPARTVKELQQTVGLGVVNGMQRALDCHKPWAVINGAVYCWNAYLTSMQDGWCVPHTCAK